MSWISLSSRYRPPEARATRPESYINQTDHDGDFYERADDCRECGAAFDAERRNGYGDGKLEIVGGRGE